MPQSASAKQEVSRLHRSEEQKLFLFHRLKKMNENCEDVIVPGQGIKRVDILDLQIAMGFSGSNRFLYLI